MDLVLGSVSEQAEQLSKHTRGLVRRGGRGRVEQRDREREGELRPELGGGEGETVEQEREKLAFLLES